MTLAAPVLLGLLLLAGCSSTGQRTDSSGPSPTAGDGPTSGRALDATCSLPWQDRTIEVAHPGAWQVGEACRFFDPEVDEAPTQPRATSIDVVLDVTEAPFHEVAGQQPARADVSRAVGAVDGRQAVRITSTTTGEGSLPDGVPQVTWLVDLDPGVDEGAGTLVASVTDVEDVDAPPAVRVLDRMMRRIDTGDTPDGVVAVAEGGGTPFAVTLRDGCLQLRARPTDAEVVDEACDLVALDADRTATGVLEGAGTSVIVGQVPPIVDLVRDTGGQDLAALTWQPPGTGVQRLFALPGDAGTTVQLLGFDGTDRGTISVGAR